MGIDALVAAVPDYAKDLRLNLSVLSTSSLDPAAVWGSASTAALVPKHPVVKQAILEEARNPLSPEQIQERLCPREHEQCLVQIQRSYGG